MNTVLLPSKHKIPPQPYHSVRRSHLIDYIEKRVPHYKLILVSTATGYGKSTLLSQWARSSSYRVGWITMSEEINEPPHFLRLLVATWAEAQPEIQESKLDILLEGRDPEANTTLASFISVANDLPDHTVFVLDDYHLIVEQPIHQALTYLLDNAPPNLHFVLSSQSEPSFSIARYRARGELVELEESDLSFSLEETKDYLSQVMGREPSQQEITGLHTQLEGWVAGLQLVALTHEQQLPASSNLKVSGKHRFIADFLAEDVLEPLISEKRDFLLKTSILEQMAGPLCDAVTGGENGQAMLERLERERLFLIPLDSEREWYRYHRLFADFLREELKRQYPLLVMKLHQRASQWYFEHGLPEQAFTHAIEANDAQLAAQIFEQYFQQKLHSGEIKLLQQWLQSIPTEWYEDNLVFSVAYGGMLVVTGQFDACNRYLDTLQQQLPDTHSQYARFTALRCFMACAKYELDQAKNLADQALHNLSEDDMGFRVDIYGALGDTYRKGGHWAEAQECYQKVLELSSAPQFQAQSVHVYGALADLELRQGHLHNAASYWRKALVSIEAPENRGVYPLPVIGWVYIRMGELLYEWNQLEAAQQHLSKGLERAELGGDTRAMIAGYLIAGRLSLTEGNTDTAQHFLEQARLLVEDKQFSHWLSRFERFQLEVWLAQDELRTAVNWSDRMLSDSKIESRPESEIAQLAIVRVLLVKGDTQSIQRAQGLLKRLILTAEKEGRMGIRLEALALQALSHWLNSDQPNALTSLEQSLRLAEPEEYIRRFADFGPPMAQLLQGAQSRGVMKEYVDELLAAFNADVFLTHSSLPEPLTPRELDVLQLLAAGLTNREIAEQLIISPETVKKHASSIYSKLNVGNRTEAGTTARELNLLQ